MTISVVINTFNSAKTLAKTLESVKGFDEVVVCDMNSSDATAEIARNAGARVVQFPGSFNYCDPARNFAISKARSSWVLVVDPDEVVTPELRMNLYRFISRPGDIKGIYIPRRNFILDRFRRSSYPDYSLRFFHKDHVDWPKEFNSVPVVDGPVKKLPSNKMELALIHLPASIDQIIDRMQRHANTEIENSSGGKVNIFHVALFPLASFLRTYIVRGGFRYGLAGFISASADAFGVFYRHARRYEENVRHKIAGGHDGELPKTLADAKRESMGANLAD